MVTVDGRPDTTRRDGDRISAQLKEHPYALGPAAGTDFGALGVDLAAVSASRRPLLRFCLDWSEQPITWRARWARR